VLFVTEMPTCPFDRLHKNRKLLYTLHWTPWDCCMVSVWILSAAFTFISTSGLRLFSILVIPTYLLFASCTELQNQMQNTEWYSSFNCVGTHLQLLSHGCLYRELGRLTCCREAGINICGKFLVVTNGQWTCLTCGQD